MGVDNVLRGLVDKLGFDCGTARGLADKNADDKPEDKESDNEDKSENDEDEAEEQVEEDEEEAGYESDDTGGYTVGKKPEYKNPNHSPNKFDRGNRFGGDKKDEAPKKKFKYPES